MDAWLGKISDEVVRRLDAVRAAEPSLTDAQAKRRVFGDDPDLRRIYEKALLDAGATLVTEATDTNDETQSFGPCTRCGAPVTWHNGLFLCADCVANHFRLPNLVLITMKGETFAAKWAGFSVAFAGAYVVEKRGEEDLDIFNPAAAQAIWYFGDAFVYAEMRRQRPDDPHESIQLVGITEGDRKDALLRATRGFDLLRFSFSKRGRHFLDEATKAQQRTQMQKIMSRYEKYPSFGMEAAAGFYGVPSSSFYRWREKYR